VPTALNGYNITSVDYAICNSTANSGSLTIGFRYLTTTNTTSSTNNFPVTFNTTDVRKTATGSLSLTSGNWLHFEVSPSAGGTLNNVIEGLLVTIKVTK